MYTVKRWNGSGWYDSMCSPYKTYKQAHDHVKEYSWHYTKEYPYKIVEAKQETKAPKKFVKTNWEGVVIV
jgi:hypothetical protein